MYPSEFTCYQIEGEVGEPYFRRLVLRCVAHIIRLYSSSLTTESEVVHLFSFTMLVIAWFVISFL